MVLLSMQNVNKSFGLNVVLKNINMTLKEGQKMGLVGVNGSGKSTLLKLITGELHPDAPNPDPGVVSLVKGTTVGLLTQFADIESDLTGDLSLHTVAEKNNVSPGYLSGVFHQETGKTFTEFVNEKRMEQGERLLRSSALQIQTIAQYCGIPDVNYFSKLFKKHYGKTPKEYRKSGQ